MPNCRSSIVGHGPRSTGWSIEGSLIEVYGLKSAACPPGTACGNISNRGPGGRALNGLPRLPEVGLLDGSAVDLSSLHRRSNVRPMISRTSIVSPRPRSGVADSSPSLEDGGSPDGALQNPPEISKVAPWQQELQKAFRRLDDLLGALNLDLKDLDDAHLPGGGDSARRDAQRQFPLRVPRPFVSRMRPGDPCDPLLRQVLTSGNEMHSPEGFVNDPLAEGPSSPQPGLLHKYDGRVLLITTGACAVHCRYCFRRHFPYTEHRPHAEHKTDAEHRSGVSGLTPWQGAVDYIAADPSIEEVILSGGDPLSLTDDKLEPLVATLEEIPHLTRLRLHTRLPVVLPQRVDDRLLSWLDRCRFQKVVVFHINHGQEIDDKVRRIAADLRHVGVTLLNQAVLLRGVNDSVEALVHMSRRLFEVGIMPYYLHLLDRVRGAAHFEVDTPRAQMLYGNMLASLPGFLVPRLVREVPQAASKMPIPLASA